jgi:hypothetical protein
MKQRLTFLIALITIAASFAQQGINYKAIVKDNLGNVVANQSIDVQFIIYEGAALTNNVYQESHTLNSDSNGIIITNIGEGTTSDVFNDINWEIDEHWLNVQVDIGSGLVDLGTTQFMTVPYAINASNVVWKKNNGTDINSINTGNVGIGTNNPTQKLDVQGKLKIGDDSQTPEEGIIRFNNSTNNFEGYNGSEWVSMNYKPIVYSYEQDPINESYNSTNRDILQAFPNTLTIEEPGKYMCFFDVTFYNLNGNTTTLSSDRSLYLEFQIYNRLEFYSVGPNIVGLPSGFTYYFRNRENIQLHRIIDIPTANQTMEFRFRVNSNTCCTPQTLQYSIINVKMTAIKLD